MKIISRSARISGSGQHASYVEHVDVTHGVEHKLRVTISLDSYVSQSSAQVERWDGSKWQEVVRIPGREIKMDTSFGYRLDKLQPSLQRAAFQPDREQLLALTLEVLE